MAPNVLSLLDRIRVYKERETAFSQALQSAIDEAETMEAAMSASITALSKDNARLQTEVALLSMGPEYNSDSDSDYESESEAEAEEEEEPKKERPWLRDVFESLEEAGNRAQRFARILRTTVPYPNYDINDVYNEVLKTDRYTGVVQKEDIHPNFWTALGYNEEEKLENAKKVMELLYNCT